MTHQERMDALVRHIDMVRENCRILAEKLADKGEIEMSIGLHKNSYIHDNSKFSGIEWQFLTDPTTTNKAGLKYAIEHHQRTNPHHPEYWGNIKEMPLIYRYEMIADITARGSEMATSARDFLNITMPKKYGFPKDGDIHKQLVSILDMLCPQPFTAVEIIQEAPVLAEPTPNHNPGCELGENWKQCPACLATDPRAATLK